MKAIIIVFAIAFLSFNAMADSEQIDTAVKIDELKYGSGKIAVGTISVDYSQSVKFKPDIAEFSVTYITDGATPNAASNRNIENTRIFQTYLKSLGIKESDITTADYKNYMGSDRERNETTYFLAKLVVSFDMKRENFMEVMKLLESNGITDLTKDRKKDRYYITIYNSDALEEKARKAVLSRFEKVDKLLKESGVSNTDVSEYDTEKKSKTTSTDIKKYFVSNTMKIKTANLDGIGKIVSKAQELKMNVNDDIFYSVSDAQKQELIKASEAKLYEKLVEKAGGILGKSGYFVGAPKNLRVSSRDDADYNSGSRYYNYRGANVINSGQVQTHQALDADIKPPSEYEIMLLISGEFDIVSTTKSKK